jgi:putative alpha-1,2-mannosidase
MVFLYTCRTTFWYGQTGASTDGTYGNEQGWEAVGYEDAHTSIDGFPFFHEFQIGGVSLMPVTGEVKNQPGLLENPDGGFRSRFEKSDEVAMPGFYSVILKDYQVKVELTATPRVGFQRYTFPETSDAHILFNIGNRQGESGAVRDAYVKQVDEFTVEGYVGHRTGVREEVSGRATVSMYFYAKLDRAAETVNVFYQGGEILPGNEISGPGAMLCLNFNTKEGEQINVRTGLSYTSIDNARLNFEREANDLGFDEARQSAVEKWNHYLGRIRVTGGMMPTRSSSTPASIMHSWEGDWPAT